MRVPIRAARDAAGPNPGLAGAMTGTVPPGRPRPTPAAPGERLAALLAEAEQVHGARGPGAAVPRTVDPRSGGARPPGEEAPGPQEPRPAPAPAAGPAHRWEVAARTRVPFPLLLLAVVGLAVLAWFELGPGAVPASEDPGGAVLAEVGTSDGPGAGDPAPGSAPVSPAAPEGPAAVLPPAGPSPGPPRPIASPSAAQRLAVHVTGEVARPGVVQVDPGDRVVDAVEAAGGLTEHAATAAVNLAAPVADGQQVVVPDARAVPAVAAGDAAVSGTQPAPGVPAPPGAAVHGAAQTGAPVNLNTASAADLDTLPRVGPVLAGRIVAFRDQHGGFASVADLDAVPGIGPTLMESLAPLVTV